MTYNEVKHILSNSNACLISTELTKEGNVHYHAIIHFRSNLNRITVINNIKKKRILGYYKITHNAITHIDNLKRTIQYLHKDVSTTKSILHKGGYKPPIVERIN